MSLKHILLGVLEQPCSGYDIKGEFDRVFRYFWSAELAQIYPALDKLERDGLALSSQKASEKGPSRRVYQRTELGRQELLRWLADPVVGKDRIHFLSQVFFLDGIAVADRLRYMQQLRNHFADSLAALITEEDAWRAEQPGYPDNLNDQAQCQQFTMRLGLKRMAASLEWCDECIALLSRGNRQGVVSRSEDEEDRHVSAHASPAKLSHVRD